MPDARLQRAREIYCHHSSLSDRVGHYVCQSCGARLPHEHVQDWLAIVIANKVQRERERLVLES